MPHVVLLGDSIFDNGAYVPGGPDVGAQLRGRLPAAWETTLCAVDGAVVADVERQLANLPAGATHLVLSVGGNDALAWLGVLDRGAASVAEVLDLLAGIGDGFERQYRHMLWQVLGLGLPVVVCTIYNGRLGDEALQRRAQTALTIFNDVVLRSASAAGLPCIELRHVCTEAGDYANPIEPSVQGGGKIAAAIADVLLRGDPAGGRASAQLR
jgi:hypothetical protein